MGKLYKSKNGINERMIKIKALYKSKSDIGKLNKRVITLKEIIV